jgi:Asp-tRNA(Asn)/Glu-tRNA(Gln) amidotransferase B subunit
MKAPSSLSVKSSSAHKKSIFKDRFASPARKQPVMNHPDVDPTKLTKEQGQKIAEQIQLIKQLEREYDEIRLKNMQVKEEQNKAMKQQKELEDIFNECVMECNNFILKQQEVHNSGSQAQTYFFELYKT